MRTHVEVGGGFSGSDIQRGRSFKTNPCSLKLKQFADLVPRGAVFPVVASRRVFSQVDHSQPGGGRGRGEKKERETLLEDTAFLARGARWTFGPL